MADAEQTLRDVVNTLLDERDYKPRDIEVNAVSTGGANYTSSLFTITASSPDRDDLKLFGKVACIGEAMRACMSGDWLYENERFVYTKLAKIYDDIQESNNLSIEERFVFPKFYGCNAELGKETIVMENLIETGYSTFNRFESMDWDHAIAGVENLARFHALSFAFEKYHPEEFDKLTPDMQFRQGHEDEDPSETMKELFERMINGALEVVKDDQREPLRTFILNNKLIKKYNKPIGKPIISHGDYRLSNLLFRTQNGVLQSIAVDYQTVHAGCPAGDLMYFIFMGSDEEFRRHHYENLLDHYYSSLEKALERLSVETSVYSREKFDSDMKELLPYAVLVGVMILPVVTVDAESAPKVQDDADVSDFVMKPNELFAQRFSGIVNDIIRWGAI